MYGDECTSVYLGENLIPVEFGKIKYERIEDEDDDNREIRDPDYSDRSETNNYLTAKEMLLNTFKDDDEEEEDSRVIVPAVKGLDDYSQGNIKDSYVLLTPCDQVNSKNTTVTTTNGKCDSNVMKIENMRSLNSDDNLTKYHGTRLWQYITQTEGDIVKCNLCPQLFSCRFNDTSSIRKHIYLKHSISVDDRINEYRPCKSGVSKKTNKYRNVWDYCTQKDNMWVECNICHGLFSFINMKLHLLQTHELFEDSEIITRTWSPTVRSKKVKVNIWKFYTMKNCFYAVCNLCFTEVTYEKGTNSLRRHFISEHHPELLSHKHKPIDAFRHKRKRVKHGGSNELQETKNKTNIRVKEISKAGNNKLYHHVNAMLEDDDNKQHLGDEQVTTEKSNDSSGCKDFVSDDNLEKRKKMKSINETPSQKGMKLQLKPTCRRRIQNESGSSTEEENITINFKLINSSIAKCNLCLKEVWYEGQLMYLKKHLRIGHNILFTDASLQLNNEESTNEPIVNRQNSFENEIEKSVNEELQEDTSNYKLAEDNAVDSGEHTVLSYFIKSADRVKCKICLKFLMYKDGDLNNLSIHVLEEHVRKLSPYMKTEVQNDEANSTSVKDTPPVKTTSNNYNNLLFFGKQSNNPLECMSMSELAENFVAGCKQCDKRFSLEECFKDSILSTHFHFEHCNQCSEIRSLLPYHF